METLFLNNGRLFSIIAGMMAILSCMLFDNAFIIAFFISLFGVCIYLTLGVKVNYQAPHQLIDSSIEKLNGYRYGRNVGKVNEFIGLLGAIDSQITIMQDISGPRGTKKAYRESCNKYIEKSLDVVRINTERITVLCSLEAGEEVDGLAEQVLKRMQDLVKTMDDLIMSFTNIGYQNDAEVIQMIKDYADSLDKLN